MLVEQGVGTHPSQLLCVFWHVPLHTACTAPHNMATGHCTHANQPQAYVHTVFLEVLVGWAGARPE